MKSSNLDNARKLRGIYFIDPEDKEFKETINKAHKKFETPMAPAMPCKTCKKSKHGGTHGKSNQIKSKLSGGDQVLRTSPLIRYRPDRGEE